LVPPYSSKEEPVNTHYGQAGIERSVLLVAKP